MICLITWERWHAWFPVRDVYTGRLMWLRQVERAWWCFGWVYRMPAE